MWENIRIDKEKLIFLQITFEEIAFFISKLKF